MTTKDTISPKNFESALKELETVVGDLEKGDLSLEQSLKSFERGVLLTRNCQKALTEAEQKVQKLSQNTETATLETFQREDDSEL